MSVIIHQGSLDVSRHSNWSTPIDYWLGHEITGLSKAINQQHLNLNMLNPSKFAEQNWSVVTHNLTLKLQKRKNFLTNGKNTEDDVSCQCNLCINFSINANNLLLRFTWKPVHNALLFKIAWVHSLVSSLHCRNKALFDHGTIIHTGILC